MKKFVFLPVLFLLTVSAPAAAADEAALCDSLLKQKEEALQNLVKENALLQEKLKSLEGSLTADMLARKNLQRLQEVAADTRMQRQTLADFEAYVKWMSANLSGYAKYVEAGSVAAGFAKVLPIPYAGQAGLFTRFASQFALSLNAASVSMARYLDTSRQFVARVDLLDPARPNAAEISALAKLANDKLLSDMVDVRSKLAVTGELSASALSFLETLNHYMGSTDEYWTKTKAMFKKGDGDKKEKSFLSESIQGLKNRAGSFNGRLKSFNETAEKDAPLIKSLVTFDELIHEVETGKVQVQARK
ncbi:hypothetical protein [Geotalea sp. SG265]|uniref:hypothetical protein n=1 Tax=Geotalea sp. SG265 TaxID=2922867 RepID=UPI001FAFF041